MDETKQCKRDEICRKIKNELKEKINKGKISERWIEQSLPREYKRRYSKCEVSSVSSSVDLLTIADTQGGTNLDKKEPASNHQGAFVISGNGSRPSKDDSQGIISELKDAIEKLLDKSITNPNKKDYETSLGTIKATVSVRSIIHSLSMPLEEKVAMEDQINNLSHECNCLLDLIISGRKNNQKELFLAYRNFLERKIDAVNQRISEL